MTGIVGKLNDSYNGLGLTIDETTVKLNYTTDELFEYVTKAAEKKKQESAKESLVSALQVFPDLKESTEKAKKESDIAFKEYQDIKAKWEKEHPVISGLGIADPLSSGEVSQALDKFNELDSKSFEASQSYDECIKNIKEYAIQIGYTDKEARKFINSLEKSSKQCWQN